MFILGIMQATSTAWEGRGKLRNVAVRIIDIFIFLFTLKTYNLDPSNAFALITGLSNGILDVGDIVVTMITAFANLIGATVCNSPNYIDCKHTSCQLWK